jgi:hypothetical protein
MAETLTLDDLKTLQRPFALDEHEFNKRGFCYVKEYFVTKRLEEVDPAWQFEVIDVHRTGVGEQLAVVTARMTVNGVTRSSTGMQAVEYTNVKDAQGKVTGKTETEAGEAEKGATTDALRRCARLFGVGRYILLMGDSVKNEKQLADWLKKHYSATGNGTQAGQQQSQSTPSKPANAQQSPAGNGNQPKPPVWWKHVIDTVKSLPHFGGQPKHVISALNKMIGAGEIMESWAASEVIAAVKAKYDADEAPAIDYSNEDIPF